MKYTVVQHSGYGYGNKEEWEHGLETRFVEKKSEIARIERAGGLLFDSYSEAEKFAEEAMWIDDTMEPKAQGTFSNLKIDDLAIYVPVRKAVG